MLNMRTVLAVLCLTFSLALAANAQSDIRKVDFKNFTYEVFDLSGENKTKITVKNGEFLRDEEDDKYFFNVMDVVYGDIDGDKKEEAIVTTIVNTGGTGNFSSGQIYTMKNGKPVVLTEFEGGDRAYGGLVGVKVADGILSVERYSPGENGGACCAELIETTRYKWNGKELVQTGETESREIYPASRIAFEKGASSSVFKLKLPNTEVKRFKIGARKGQILTVTTDAKPASDVSFRLVSGDGEETETGGRLVVKLNASGDYVFEISNFSEKDLNVSVTVKIN